MANVFICYRRVDAGDAGRLQANLRYVPGIELQFDINSIRGGEDFVDRLQQELAVADLMIVVVSRTWVDVLQARQHDPEDFVLTEVNTALTRGIPILPIRVQGAPAPMASDLPDPIKGLARIHSLELRHERYDDDLALLIGRLRGLLDLQSSGSLPIDEAARLSQLQTQLQRLRRTGSWAATSLWALAVIAMFVIVEPAVQIATQVSRELADASSMLRVGADDASAGTALSVVAADSLRPALEGTTSRLGSRDTDSPAAAEQEWPARIGSVPVAAWPFLPAAPVMATLSVAGVLGALLPAGSIAVILFVRYKGRRLTIDLASWLESRRHKSGGTPASPVRPSPATLVFETLRTGHHADVLGTPIGARPPILALAALLSLFAMAAYMTVLVYLGSRYVASPIVVIALPLMIIGGSMWMTWAYCTLTATDAAGRTIAG